jgi:uncharacterized membrane protein YfcA
MLGMTCAVSMSISIIGALPLLNQVDLIPFLSIAPTSAVFAFLGFKLSRNIEGNILEKILGIFLFSMGFLLLYPILGKVF